MRWVENRVNAITICLHKNVTRHDWLKVRRNGTFRNEPIAKYKCESNKWIDDFELFSFYIQLRELKSYSMKTYQYLFCSSSESESELGQHLIGNAFLFLHSNVNYINTCECDTVHYNFFVLKVCYFFSLVISVTQCDLFDFIWPSHQKRKRSKYNENRLTFTLIVARNMIRNETCVLFLVSLSIYPNRFDVWRTVCFFCSEDCEENENEIQRLKMKLRARSVPQAPWTVKQTVQTHWFHNRL